MLPKTEFVKRNLFLLEGPARPISIDERKKKAAASARGFSTSKKRGSNPHIVSQMIAVVDLFDALRTNRPCREPLPQNQIVQILTQEGGTAFNPYLVERFLNLIEISSRWRGYAPQKLTPGTR